MYLFFNHYIWLLTLNEDGRTYKRLKERLYMTKTVHIKRKTDNKIEKAEIRSIFRDKNHVKIDYSDKDAYEIIPYNSIDYLVVFE